MNRRARRILWLDAVAAAAAGCSVLSLHDWLAQLHGFSTNLVLFIGTANVAYAAYSGSLATRASFFSPPSRRGIDALVLANTLWAAVCTTLVVTTWHTATPYGLTHVAFEGLFVGSLALAEWHLVRPATRST